MTRLINADLPEGWVVAPLPDAFDVNPPKPKADALPGDAPVTFAPMGAVDAAHGAITAPEERPFADVRRAYTAFANRDVIMAKITPCFENGKAAVAADLKNGLGFGSSEFHVFRPKGPVLSEYLFHYIRQERFRQEAAENMTSTAGQARVPADYVRELLLPVPPLAEQRRIVAKVEALVAQVNAARERLAKVPSILKRFRQAVLAAACSGRLTEDWRGSHGDPSRSELNDLPNAWSVCQLSDVSQKITDGEHLSPTIAETGVPMLSAKDVTDRGVILSYAKYVSETDARKFQKRCDPRRGDILIVSRGATIGRTTTVETEERFCLMGSVILVRPAATVLGEFIAAALRSPAGQEGLRTLCGHSAQQAIYIRDIRTLELPVPPIAEQHEIIRRVGGFFRLTDTIERRVAVATARAEKLTQSTLSKAFSGELVPTEAELAKAEGRSYEPASVLLEKIRAEKERGEAAAARGVVRRSGGTQRRGRGAAQAQNPHPRAPSPRRRERGSKNKR